jgi:uncharacterized protein (DUF2235 family)
MKRLAICCDGTWNTADQEHDGAPCPTNVVKLAYRVAKRGRDGVAQIIYYDQGVGTGNAVDRYTGGAVGDGLEENIHDAYRFLVANYEPNDEIFLFGFSRGAFTARSIGGMIRKCGVLRRESVRAYREALDLYRSEQRPADDGPCKFRKDHSVTGAQDIPIRFVGVWDTVGSLGIPLRGLRGLTRQKHQFHDTELSGTVERAYHALAIDEHRAPFEPTLWDYKPKPGQTIEQVWFAGAHSDVGGGYAEAGLSNIALEWMLGKAEQAGLTLDPDAVAAYPIAPDHRADVHVSKNGLYRLTKGIDRALGLTATEPRQPDPTQSVHESVLRRWDEVPGYRPDALREYFRRVGDPRAQGA